MASASAVPRRSVLAVALISEGALALLALLWAFFAGVRLPLHIDARLVLIGACAAAPLAILNFLTFFAGARRRTIFRRFVEEVVVPVCAGLTVTDAALVALAAGIGEELFFRGVMNPVLCAFLGAPAGVLLASALFAYAHFIGRAREYRLLIVFYTVFGVYFSCLVLLWSDLTPAIVCHALYNFLAILYVRYREAPAAEDRGVRPE